MPKASVWPLCSIYSNGGHVFPRIKNPHINSMQDTLGTFVPSLVSFSKVVSEKKIFDRNKFKNSKKCWRKAITPTMA